MPIVIEPGLDADGFCLQLKQNINDMGVARAFGLGKIVVAYSGPSETIKGIITTSFTNNWVRSRDQAARMGGRRIDDTAIGKFLTTFDFGAYFTTFYKGDRKAVERATFAVWGFASSEFMKAKFYALATAVCAADPDRVFRKFEIAAVLENPRVNTINNRPIDLFKDFFKIHIDEAYRLFCLTELMEARTRATKENTTEAWADYRERRAFYMLERSIAAPYATTLTIDQIKEGRRFAIAASHMVAATKALGAKRPVRRSRAPKVGSKPV